MKEETKEALDVLVPFSALVLGIVAALYFLWNLLMIGIVFRGY